MDFGLLLWTKRMTQGYQLALLLSTCAEQVEGVILRHFFILCVLLLETSIMLKSCGWGGWLFHKILETAQIQIPLSLFLFDFGLGLGLVDISSCYITVRSPERREVGEGPL